MRIVCMAAALSLGIAACVSPPIAVSAAGDPSPAGETAMSGCDAKAAAFTMGRPYTEALGEEARVAAGAETVRAIPAGLNVTMEFVASRLSLSLDEAGAVIDVTCG